MKDQRLVLSSVSADESLVKDFIQQTIDIFHANTLGPQKYLNLYRKYNDLLNGKSDQEVTNYLSRRHAIDSFIRVSCLFSWLIREPVVVVVAQQLFSIRYKEEWAREREMELFAASRCAWWRIIDE